MAFLDLFKDLKENVNDRLKSPFVISFLVTWCAQNWLLIYEVLAFDDSSSLGYKIDIIGSYVKLHRWNNLTLYPLLWSVATITVYLFFNGIGLLLFGCYTRYAKPFIYNVTTKSKLVTREQYNELNHRADILRKDNSELKESNLEVEKIRDELEEENANQHGQISALNEQLRKLNDENQQFRSREEKLEGVTFSMSTDVADAALRDILGNLVWFYYWASKKGLEKKFAFQYANNIMYVNNVPQYKVANIEIDKTWKFIRFDKINFENPKIVQRIILLRVEQGVLRGTEYGPDVIIPNASGEREIVISNREPVSHILLA